MSKADRLPGGKWTKNKVARVTNTRSDQIGNDWAKWVKNWKNWFVCRIWLADHPDPEIELYMPERENHLIKPLSIILTDMTESEILAMQELFIEMFAMAIPICRARDQRAKEAYEAGEDADRRLYREVSSVFTRPWALGINGESLLQRLDDLPSAKRIALRRAKENGFSSNDVAEDDTPDDGAEDDLSPRSELEGLGEVRGPTDPD